MVPGSRRVIDRVNEASSDWLYLPLYTSFPSQHTFFFYHHTTSNDTHPSPPHQLPLPLLRPLPTTMPPKAAAAANGSITISANHARILRAVLSHVNYDGVFVPAGQDLNLNPPRMA